MLSIRSGEIGSMRQTGNTTIMPNREGCSVVPVLVVEIAVDSSQNLSQAIVAMSVAIRAVDAAMV